MAQFHFVEDYEKLVGDLIATHPIDEAMAIAVGGKYELIGQIELDMLKEAGLDDGMSVFDLGCGSGRLAFTIAKSGLDISYLGTDIVQALLDYARSKTPDSYRFICHRDLSIPAEDSSVDIACAFSVFTHLLHHETYIYLEEMRRVLKPNGRIVFSFLEFGPPGQWAVFEDTVLHQKRQTTPHLNTFIERNAIAAWASHLDLKVDRFIGGWEPVRNNVPLGQSVVVLRR